MNTPFTQAPNKPYLSSESALTSNASESSQSPQVVSPKNQYGENFVYPLVFFSILITLIYLFRTIFLKSPVIDQLKQPKPTAKYPCLNCQYFSNNPYLMCAIRPKTALTEESKDCSDYQKKNVD